MTYTVAAAASTPAFACVPERSGTPDDAVRYPTPRLFDDRTAPIFDGGTASANVWRPNHRNRTRERTLLRHEPEGLLKSSASAETGPWARALAIVRNARERSSPRTKSPVLFRGATERSGLAIPDQARLSPHDFPMRAGRRQPAAYFRGPSQS